MYMYLFAGAFLLLAFVFIIKFFVDTKKARKQDEEAAKEKTDITVLIDDDKAPKNMGKKVKTDIALALVFMALCEVCLLLANKILGE